MMGLKVLVGVAPERLVERAKSGLSGYANDAADFVNRDTAQPKRDDLLLAPGDVHLRLRGALIAAASPSQKSHRNLVLCNVIVS
jgi:hypothetical protein